MKVPIHRGSPLHELSFLLIDSREGWQLAQRGAASTAARFAAYHAGRGCDGVATPASRTARMPVRKIPSNVPAPPIEATGAPRPVILSRLRRSAPMRVPIEPPI